MAAGEVFPVVGVIVLAIGLALTWIRNGRGQAKRDGIIEEKITGINKRLDDPDSGLGAIKKSVDKQSFRCAGVTSGFEERIKTLEEE